MGNEHKQSGVVTAKDATTTLASVSAAATAALVVDPASAPGVLALAAALVAVFPPVLGAITEAGVRRMRARADRFYSKLADEWARDKNWTHEEVASRLEAAKEDPNVADTVWRAVRGLMEAPNDAAAVPLGVLTAEYMRDRRPADSFFRGLVRLLQELETKELEELRQLLGWVLSETKRAEVELVARRGAVDTARDEFVDDVGVDGMPDKRSSTTAVTEPARLFGLLTINGLAVSNPGMRFDGGYPEITVRRSTVERLFRTLIEG